MTGPSGQGTTTPPEEPPGWTLLPDWLQTALDGMEATFGINPLSVFWALVVLLVGWYVSKLVVQHLGRPVARRFQRPSLTQTVLRGIRVSVMLFSGLIALNVLGLELGNIVLSVTVFSAVLGIVLAPIVGSVINGVFVLADQPFEIGDMIELADRNQTGFVEDITLRYTKVFTLDNTFLVIPNSGIRERDVVNYSAEDERTRLSLTVVVTYEGDLDEARRLMERAAREVEDVITGGPDIRVGSARYPASPTCYIDEFGDHGVVLTLRYWVKRPYKLLSLRSQVQTNVWDALADADVEIAYPHSHVVFDETSGEARVRLGESRVTNGRATARPEDSGVDEHGPTDRRTGDPEDG